MAERNTLSDHGHHDGHADEKSECRSHGCETASNTSAVDERCSGETCDERCIRAAAAVECLAACEHETKKGRRALAGATSGHRANQGRSDSETTYREPPVHEHEHDENDNHGTDACPDHLRAAFTRYTSFLEDALCICIKIQAKFCTAPANAMPSTRKHQHDLEERSHVFPKVTSSGCATELMPHGNVVHRRRSHEHSSRGLQLQDKSKASVSTQVEDIACESKCCSGPATIPTSLAAVKSSYKDTCCGEMPSTSEKGCCGSDHPSAGALDPCLPRGGRLTDIEKQSQANDLETVTFNVTGMDCSGCGNILARAFRGIPGVHNVSVTFITGAASCDIDPRKITSAEVQGLVERATKYKLTPVDTTLPSLEIVMDPDVAKEVSQKLPDGVTNIRTVSKRRYEVTYNPAVVGARRVLGSLPGASLAPPSQDEGLVAGYNRLRNVFWTTVLSFSLTIPVVVLSWANPPVSERNTLYISVALATVVQAIAIQEFYQPALSALVYNRVIEMDMLVVISITAAYGYSIVAFALILSGKGNDTIEPLFETSTLLISLILLGRLVAAYARKRAVAAVSLRSLQATTAVLISEFGVSSDVDARLLEIGDIVHIGAHCQVVTDGVVIAGTSDVDESMITGEAIPVVKSLGDHVIAGTINQGGIITIRIKRLPGKNTVTDIANLVEQAQSSKPRVQDLADKVAGYFIPVVVSISIIVTIIWVVVELKVRNRPSGAAVGNAITYGIAVLAVSCPCALGLAVPMVLVIAGGVAARLGIIIKTADVVERGFKCTDVIFDKTGTLTESVLDVIDERVFSRPTLPSGDILALVRTMVKDNAHPVSKAIEHCLESRGVRTTDLTAVESVPGAGVRCEWNGVAVRGGNPDWLGAQSDEVSALASKGLTMFCVGDDAGLLAVFGLRNCLRKEAKSVVQELQSRQIQVHVVSGDGTRAVEAVASELGINSSNIASKQSPENKQQYICRLKEKGRVVLFCGDGTNDAVAVAEAHVGVQIESSSDVTRATSDVVLLGNLKGVPQLLDISKAAFHRIMFNFMWAALYNVFAILLAGGAFVRVRIPPAYAGLGEIVSVVPVVVTAATLISRNFT